MYIDTELNTILTTLPILYKHTSNFNALSDYELRTLNVYKINSFIEDAAYLDFLSVLGTQYYIDAEITVIPGLINPGDYVQVIINSDRIIQQIINTTGISGKFENVHAAIVNRPTIEQVEPETIQIEESYDYDQSYVFVIFGQSILSLYTKPSTAKFKYSLMCNAPQSLPKLKIGNIVKQESGFFGTVAYINKSLKLIKLTNCKNIDLIDRLAPLTLDDISLGDVFCYELYLYTNDFTYTEYTEHTPLGLLSQNIQLYNLFSCPELNYINKYNCIVNDEQHALIKIESSVKDLSEYNTRVITNYGRYE